MGILKLTCTLNGAMSPKKLLDEDALAIVGNH
jgi:hypothetical protein